MAAGSLLAKMRGGGALLLFFLLKVVFGLLLLRASTSMLDTAGFVAFSQLFLWLALLATLSAAGVQNGLTRQIALARGDRPTERRSIRAAGRIWIGATAAVLVLSAALSRQVSELLVGNASLSPVIPLVSAAAAAGGLGVLACAVLNGRRRAATSLSLQSIGLTLGGALCLWRLLRGDPVGAVLGYAAGPVATTALAAALLARRRGSEGQAADPATERAAASDGETGLLLRYAATFLVTATILPATLFALRYLYREEFGAELLSYWLAANRVSDVTSQILGLYMAQIFLPQAAHEDDPSRLRRLVRTTLLGGTAIMLGGWAVFAIGAPLWVDVFLSAAFLPAIPFIAGYLLGDGLRVTASLTSHLMMARGRPGAALGVEVATAALIAAFVSGLAWWGRPDAPWLGYIAAFAVLTLVLLPKWLRRGGSVEVEGPGH